jgi:GT2 family glycosyltransferase
MRIVVGIATSGRPDVLADTVALLALQSRRPDLVIICPASPSDFDRTALAADSPPVSVVQGPRGSCHQRNAIIESTLDADLIAFLDDDFVPAHDFIAQAELLFSQHEDIVVATGDVLADGVLGVGLSLAEAEKIVTDSTPDHASEATDVYNGYGCNLVVRVSPLRLHPIRFDENLPLYAWQEDVDLSRQLAAFGRVVQSRRLRGVHLGSKRGPGKGLSFGYSQIANPVYLSRKGTVSWKHSVPQMLRNVASNALHFARPEVWVDRRGRLRGNLLGVLDLCRGRLDPNRILKF